MPIVEADIEYRLSGGIANADPNASIGEEMSSELWAGGVVHDLFDVISGDENALSTVDYRCVYVINTHATLTLIGAKLWVVSQVANGATGAIGLDPAGVGNGTTTGVADNPANETTAPSGVSFSAPASKAAGLTIGDLAPAVAHAIWIRRTAANNAALDNDGMVIRVEGDTAA